MTPFEFNQSKFFLEGLIAKNPENEKLLESYNHLITKRTEYNINFDKVLSEKEKHFASCDKEYNINYNNNLKDFELNKMNSSNHIR